MFDGYDTGVRFMDDHVGRLLDDLARLGVLDETAIVVSADHGETLGEPNIYGDHQTADEHTCRLPMIVRWPGLGGPRVDAGLHYQFDVFASLLELAGGELPEGWDARSFAPALRQQRQDGRPYLVLSQGAWTCQRAVRFDDYLCIRTYHDGYHAFPDVQLFDVARDPHEQTDLAEREPERAEHALQLLQAWHDEMMQAALTPDPLRLVIEEGGPFHVRDQLPAYLERLRQTGRAAIADALSQRHPRAASAK
jgi:arylsulfatase A-like enzyme